MIVDFGLVKINTISTGRPVDLIKLKNDPKYRNNMFAIPVLNKNYLMGVVEAGVKIGIETMSIIKKATIIYKSE